MDGQDAAADIVERVAPCSHVASWTPRHPTAGRTTDSQRNG